MAAYSWEREKYRGALAVMTELDRAATCTHTRVSRRGICADCGDRVDG